MHRGLVSSHFIRRMLCDDRYGTQFRGFPECLPASFTVTLARFQSDNPLPLRTHLHSELLMVVLTESYAIADPSGRTVW